MFNIVGQLGFIFSSRNFQIPHALILGFTSSIQQKICISKRGIWLVLMPPPAIALFKLVLDLFPGSKMKLMLYQ